MTKDTQPDSLRQQLITDLEKYKNFGTPFTGDMADHIIEMFSALYAPKADEKTPEGVLTSPKSRIQPVYHTPKADETVEEILHDLYLAGWNDKLCDDSPTYIPSEHVAKLDAKRALEAYYSEREKRARIDEVTSFTSAVYGHDPLAPVYIAELRDVRIASLQEPTNEK